MALHPLFNSAPISTLLSDNSAEYWIDRDSDGAISIDDILWGIVSIGTIGPTAIGAGTAYNELTVIQASKISGVSGIRPAPGAQGVAGVMIADYTNVSLDAADAPWFDWGTGTINLDGAGASDYTFTTAFGATNDGKTYALAFEDSLPDYTRDSTIQAGLTSSTNGSKRVLVTIDTTVSLLDELLVTAPLNPLAAAGIIGSPATSISGTSIGFNGTIAAQDWPGLMLHTNITGGTGGFSTPSVGTLASGDPWQVFDNVDFTVTAQKVPEPGSLALLSIALLGLATRWRSAKNNT